MTFRITEKNGCWCFMTHRYWYDFSSLASRIEHIDFADVCFWLWLGLFYNKRTKSNSWTCWEFCDSGAFGCARLNKITLTSEKYNIKRGMRKSPEYLALQLHVAQFPSVFLLVSQRTKPRCSLLWNPRCDLPSWNFFPPLLPGQARVSATFFFFFISSSSRWFCLLIKCQGIERASERGWRFISRGGVGCK